MAAPPAIRFIDNPKLGSLIVIFIDPIFLFF